MSKSFTHDMDVIIGQTMRARRENLGLSRERAVEGIGITWQQLQKYESGVNRVTAARLFLFAKKYKMPLSAFFEGVS